VAELFKPIEGGNARRQEDSVGLGHVEQTLKVYDLEALAGAVAMVTPR